MTTKRTTTRNGSSKLTQTVRVTSEGVKRTTSRSTTAGRTRTSTNLGTGKTRKTKLW